MQSEYCQQCRQPLEEWEAGFCEGCGTMTIATRIMKTAAKFDRTTLKGRKLFSLQRGKFERLLMALSIPLRDSALRAFDKIGK
jgi:hypothetical protein